MASSSQVRTAGMAGVAYAWDFPAVLQLGALMGADLEALADLLPALEGHVLRAWQKES